MTRLGRLAHPLALLGLSAFVFWIHSPSLRLGWRNHDEILFLLMAQCYRPFEYFFSPDVHHLFSSTNLTPWAVLSFDADLSLFGLNAVAFHLHHIVDIALVAGLSYALLVRWCRPAVAFATVLLFTLTSPMATASASLPIRHYLEGAVLVLVSALLAVFAQENPSRARRWLLAASAAAYAAALTAKEIYAPLPLVIFSLVGGPWGKRWQASRLHFLVAGIYLVWRVHMLGGVVGGYRVGGGSVLSLATCLPGGWFLLSSLPKFLFLSPRSGYLLLAAVGLLAIRLPIDRKRILQWVVLFACAVGPVVPVGLVAKLFGVGFSLRFYMVPAWAICAAFALAVERQPWKVLRHAAVAMAVTLAVVAASRVGPFLETYEASTRHDAACVDFALESGGDRALDLTPSIFLTEALAGAVQLRRTRAEGSPSSILAGPTTLPADLATRDVFVRGDFPSCFEKNASRRAALVSQAATVGISTRSEPHVDWKTDGVAWDLRAADVSVANLVVRSDTGSFEKRAVAKQGSFFDLKQQLWLYHVTEPAELFFVWSTPQGRTERTPGIAVPSDYFRFWEGTPCR